MTAGDHAGIRFVKSHGAGNDFVLIEDLADRLRLTPTLVRALCDRHRGVGADGIIRIAPALDADVFMDYYNSDGKAAEMCGNGIRCLAKYLADRGLVSGETIEVGTRAGRKRVEVHRGPDRLVERVRVDMGEPILDPASIPVATGGDPLHQPLAIAGAHLEAACVSMGNPHAVIFVEDLAAVAVERIGPAVETHPMFPARVNTEFVEVLSRDEVRARVWERGVGETLACGTGACAIAVAGALRGITERTVRVHLPGGTLEIEWSPEGTVFMTGPVEEVFSGELDARLLAIASEDEREPERALQAARAREGGDEVIR